MSGRATTVARRYAEVLLELAREAGQVREIRTELSALAEWMREDVTLREALVNPRVSADEKRRVLWALRPSMSDLFRRFLDLLLRKGRVRELPDIAEAYQELADALEGVLRATVESVVPLTESERQAVVERLRARYGREILLEERQNPLLIGGIRVRVGDEVLDLSLQNRLKRLKERLIAAGVAGNGG